MVRPGNFKYNEETAEDNVFQKKLESASESEIQEKVISEFDGMVDLLQRAGIKVLVYREKENSDNPDSIFPNNWFSTHSDGSFITFPMFAPSRRGERNENIIDFVKEEFSVEQRYSFEQYEKKNQFLEGTGSMIFDRKERIVYASLSERTHIQLLDKFCLLRNYEKVAFDSLDQRGKPIYHTNVMMCIGTDVAIIASSTIDDQKERKTLIDNLKNDGKTIIDITEEQMHHFAGNMLEVTNRSGDKIMVMSDQAKSALTDQQINQLEKYTTIVTSDLSVIEKYGGGSARCMMAEVFLPKAD
jgi:hypothetical protein